MSGSLGHDAFASQLVAVQRRLYSYILTLLPSLSDADDVLQETNAVLLRKRDQFVPDTDFAHWACRVAYFEVLTYRRGKYRERSRLFFTTEELLDDMAGEAATRYAGDESIPITRLESCMGKLSPLHRELLRLRYRKNQSSEQIATATGRSASAVRQLLYRVRNQLLTCLQRERQKEERR